MMAFEGMGDLWPRVRPSRGSFVRSWGVLRENFEILLERQYCEYSTVNEFFENGTIREADKLWVKSEILEARKIK